jgi:streptogramin lyase
MYHFILEIDQIEANRVGYRPLGIGAHDENFVLIQDSDGGRWNTDIGRYADGRTKSDLELLQFALSNGGAFGLTG